jgi:hypothetical protein
MIFRKLLIAAAASLVPLAAPAIAQNTAQPTLRAGATVTDDAGGEVGTIVAIDGDTLTLRTDRHEVRLPVTSFRPTATTIKFGMTREQLNAAVDAAEARAANAFSVGSPVRDRDGAPVGTVSALDAEMVTIRLAAGRVRVPRDGLRATPQGLVIGAALAELEAAATADPESDPQVEDAQ